ncbi:MAG: hypothetical protein EAZ67_04185 [Cytophagales bacterium]|nr:MAG: hypothetical protein EAZ67_04185 [Cytophagales bacterium]
MISKLKFSLVAVCAFSVLSLTACIEDHNKPYVKPKNKDSERIYGNIGGSARQLANKYEDPKNAVDRASAVREKFYPR